MAQLPDLDTTQAGLTAYWNALDDGGVTASNFDLANAINYGNLQSWESYDNGVRGTVTHGSPRTSNPTVNFRIKSDGWHVVYSDTDYHYSKAGRAANSNRLFDVLQDFAGLTAPDATFNGADCGLYDYVHEPTEIWWLNEQGDSYSGSGAYLYYDSPAVLERADIVTYAFDAASSGIADVYVSGGDYTGNTKVKQLTLNAGTTYDSKSNGNDYAAGWKQRVALLFSR